MRSGITPVVAVVLLLMMTVGAAGGAYTWFSQVQESAQDEASAALDTRLDVRGLRCDDADVVLTVSNTGDAEIEDGSADAYLYRDGDLLADGDVDLSGRDMVTPGGVSELPLPFALDPGTSYRVELRFPRSGVTLERSCRGRQDRLVGHWTFEAKDPDGPRDAAQANHGNLSNNERDGTLVDFEFDADSGWSDGKIGGGIRLDGTDDMVEVEHDAAFDAAFGGDLNYTLMAWARPLEWEDYATLIQKAGCGSWSCTTAGIWAYGGGFRSVVGTSESGNPSGSYVGPTDKPSTGSWYHVAAVGNGTAVSLYVDGTYIGAEAFTPYILDNHTANTHSLTMGPRSDGHTESFNGTIDHVRVYDRNLSAATIEDIRDGEDVRTGLVGEWTFDEGRGTTAHDTSKWVPGPVGTYALDLDTDDQVDLPAMGDFSTGYTLHFWANPDAQVSAEMYRVRQGTNFMVKQETSQWRAFHRDDTGDANWNQFADVDVGAWQSVTVTWNGTARKMYKDGILRASDTIQNLTTQSIGNNFGRDFDGMLDDVRLYDTALTGEQVAALHDATS